MAEVEIGALMRHAGVDWQLATADARVKLSSLYQNINLALPLALLRERNQQRRDAPDHGDDGGR